MSNTAKTASDWIKNADAILVTASNGLSISEGLNLFANDKKFKGSFGITLWISITYQISCKLYLFHTRASLTTGVPLPESLNITAIITNLPPI